MYKNIQFSFVFDTEVLRLIPPDEKLQEIQSKWVMKEIAKGVYTFDYNLCMEDEYLIGKCAETNHTIIFLTKKGTHIGNSNSVLFVDVIAYIECNGKSKPINRISFSCPELNFIHSIRQSYNFELDPSKYINKGVFSFNALNFDSTTSNYSYFMVEDKKVKLQFSISRTISTKICDAPISLKSVLQFDFESTNDYSFIFTLFHIAKKYVQFLCYRKNVYIPISELSAPSEDGKHELFAKLYVKNESGETEEKTLERGRYIKQQYIAENEGKILTDIASNLLYLRHLPNTYEDGRHINASKFIMITSAFEWEFRRLYPNGITKSESTTNIENKATESIQQLINSSSGKLKKKYQFLKKLIKSDSLQSEIIQIGKDFDDIIGQFGKHLYKLNGQEFSYTEIGDRLASQRNHFAHGDLDEEFIGNSLLDLMFLEQVIYAMQLKFYGVNDKNIQKAINELFGLNYIIT